MTKTTSTLKKSLLGTLMACFLVCGLAMAGCQNNDTPEPADDPSTPVEPEPAAFEPYEITDSTGRTFTISEPITRVVVSGSVAQQVMLGFAPDLLVGLASDMYDEQIKYLGDYSKLPVLGQLYGGKGDLNKEAVAAVSPQIMIDWGEAKSTIYEDMENLTNDLGIPCVHIEATLDGYEAAYKMLGQILGMEERGNEIAAYCAKAYADTTAGLAKVSAEDWQSGIMVTSNSGSLGVIGNGSYQAQVFDMIVDNIAVFESPSARGTGNETDMEQIATWAPSFVLFAPGTLYEEAAADAVWSTIPAIQSGNYLEIPGEPYNWMFAPPSVSQVLGMQWLSRTLYPAAFSDDAQTVVTEYFKVFYGYDLSDAEYQTLTATSQFAALPNAA